MAIVLTNKPKRGDAVLGVLATGKLAYATHESMMNNVLDTTVYEYIGPVLERRGSKVLYAYRTSSSEQMAARYSFKLTGYTTDGTDRTGTLRIYTAASTTADYEVAYNASTVDELVTQLNTFFLDTTNPVFQTQDWYAQKNADDSITLHFAWTFNDQRSCSGRNGFTLTSNLYPDWKNLASFRRVNGAVGSGALSSLYKTLAYFRTDRSDYSPSTDVTSIARGPVCLPAYLGTSQYQSDHCALLRSVFGEGEAGWVKFMQSCLPVLPSDWGCNGVKDGKARTQYLASQMYTSHKVSENTPICSAAAYCANVETAVLPKGTFWLPTPAEVVTMLSDVRYNTVASRNADIVNELQNRMGYSAISCGSTYWTCVRYSASFAWYASGSYGVFNYGYMLYRYVAVPVSLAELA